MSLEGIQQSQCSPCCHEPKTEPVEKVFSRSLERTVSPVKAKPRYTSVSDLLSGRHLREGKELGRGHLGTVSILNSTKDRTTYVMHDQKTGVFKLIDFGEGKFDTNDLVMSLGALAYNILRHMGQAGLLGPESPIRHSASRRRISVAPLPYVPFKRFLRPS